MDQLLSYIEEPHFIEYSTHNLINNMLKDMNCLSIIGTTTG